MTPIIILSAIVLAVTILLCATFLRAWRGWLDLRRLELAALTDRSMKADTGVRIELADVRERLRKLEAIASDVDL